MKIGRLQSKMAKGRSKGKMTPVDELKIDQKINKLELVIAKDKEKLAELEQKQYYKIIVTFLVKCCPIGKNPKNNSMEIINQKSAQRVDNQLLALTHASQLLTYLTGFGGLIVPLVIWLSSKDNVLGMDEHGRLIINFQLTMLLILVISVPAILLFGLGLLGFLFVGIIGFILPIMNAVRAANGEAPSTFATIKFI